MNKDQLKKELNRFDLKANKVLGQNFLYSESVVNDMVEAADLSSDNTVLEVGPGLGILTEKILEKNCKVLAVEKDRNLVKYLEDKFKSYEKLKIVEDDILEFPISNFSSQGGSAERGGQFPNYKIIANLPFYLTSRFLRVFLESKNKPSSMILLMQKEVANRIVASDKNRSVLSVSCELYSEPKIIRQVSSRSFYPKPDVDCAVIKFKVFKKPKYNIQNIKLFFKIVKAGFSARRKQIHNNLSAGLNISSDEIKNILERTNINFKRRAQTLSLEEWFKLYKILNN